jgi:hypothetical protein
VLSRWLQRRQLGQGLLDLGGRARLFDEILPTPVLGLVELPFVSVNLQTADRRFALVLRDPQLAAIAPSSTKVSETRLDLVCGPGDADYRHALVELGFVEESAFKEAAQLMKRELTVARGNQLLRSHEGAILACAIKCRAMVKISTNGGRISRFTTSHR